jgi:UDP-glucuronate decarboxylase
MNSPDEVTGPVNLGNPKEFSIRELASQVISQTKSQSKLEFKPLPSDDPVQRQPDISLARQILHWSPSIPLEAGLQKTIRYFRELIDNTDAEDTARAAQPLRQ